MPWPYLARVREAREDSARLINPNKRPFVLSYGCELCIHIVTSYEGANDVPLHCDAQEFMPKRLSAGRQPAWLI